MINDKTPAEWEVELGQQLRDMRLRQNIDQQRLSKQAGGSVERCETSGGW